MDVEKRKRLEEKELIDHKKKKKKISVSKIGSDDEKKKNKKKAAVGGGDDDVEVEEFFEILKRIRVAVEYFEKGDERRREPTMVRPRAWNPSFEREDFDGFKVEKKKDCDEQSLEQNAVLDLNVIPDL